jgi:transposase-like protein
LPHPSRPRKPLHSLRRLSIARGARERVYERSQVHVRVRSERRRAHAAVAALTPALAVAGALEELLELVRERAALRRELESLEANGSKPFRRERVA